MTTRPEAQVDVVLAPIAAEYLAEETAAAEEETREASVSSVVSVRLPRSTLEAVRAAAARARLTPSALIRLWVTERVEETGADDDLASAVATLRRDIDRVAAISASTERPRG